MVSGELFQPKYNNQPPLEGYGRSIEAYYLRNLTKKALRTLGEAAVSGTYNHWFIKPHIPVTYQHFIPNKEINLN